jgi:FkbM family methyltransferase
VNGAEQNRTAKQIINTKTSTPTVIQPQPKPINKTTMAKKRILIAIPTARNIEPDTFKSIYDLEVPEGYETYFQYFFGYNIDQVRNLIAHWVVNGFDYLFSVDSDIAFEPDTLRKLLSYDVDMVSGLYIQRKPGEHILEVYENNGRGGVVNIPYEKIAGRGLVEIASCGFGCVLVKAEVMRAIPYPHFKYHSAIDHRNTVSEDVDFCRKATNLGFKIYADTSIRCRHIGQYTFEVRELPKRVEPLTPAAPKELAYLAHMRKIYHERHIPQAHYDYINTMNIEPMVIYDIGANVLEWSRMVKTKWPNSRCIAFEAMSEVKTIYNENEFEYQLGVLTDQDNKKIKFYQNLELTWGNSYYLEDEKLALGGRAFGEEHAVEKIGMTLDTVVRENHYPYPDLIKLDVQGAELDVLKGAKECLQHCRDIIVELQHSEYNIGSPLKDEVIEYLNSIGFQLESTICTGKHDGDYHFRRARRPEKAYILRTTDPRSIAYSEQCAQSCERIGLPYEFVQGLENVSQDQLWSKMPWPVKVHHQMKDAAACATASHFLIWQLIADRRECAIVLEHDSLMLHPIDLEIPDEQIVALGYKYKNYNDYDYQKAGPPTQIKTVRRHSGAHAYCITDKTAQLLLAEIQARGVLNAVDNFYFMRINDPGDTASVIPLGIMLPTPSICWLRESTIWEGGPSTLNYDVDETFIRHLKPQEEL